jgi:hypothetical protein
MAIKFFLMSLMVAAFQLQLAAQEFTKNVRFDDNWKFYRGKPEGAETPGFDDSKWRMLDLPHDWSIEDLPNQGLSTLSNGKTRIISGPFDSEAIGAHNTGYTIGGPLGATAFDRAEERRIELMKNAGFNAIRTAHNPPSTAFLDACDRLGMLVIEEAFDVWMVGWRSDDYHVYFKDDMAWIRR